MDDYSAKVVGLPLEEWMAFKTWVLNRAPWVSERGALINALFRLFRLLRLRFDELGAILGIAQELVYYISLATLEKVWEEIREHGIAQVEEKELERWRQEETVAGMRVIGLVTKLISAGMPLAVAERCDRVGKILARLAYFEAMRH